MSMTASTSMANREVCDLVFKDYYTKKPVLFCDYANVSSVDLTGETVFAYGGKGHPKRVSFNGERGGTLTVETQLYSVQLWQLITGGTVSDSGEYVVRKEIVTDDGTTIALDETPIDGTVFVFAQDDDCGTELSYTIDGATITLDENVDAGSTMIVYYEKQVTSGIRRINIKSTDFPKNCIIEGDTVMKTEDDEILPYRMIAYKAASQSEMSLSYSNNGDPGTLTLTFDLLADKDDNILDLLLEEEEDEDSESETED